MTREFEHYPGCRCRDPDNCSGCALTDTRQSEPNYAAWPLVYMENDRTIPAKWREAFKREMARTDNGYYARNLRATMVRCGVRFSDSKGLAL
jgi:hypothetical protein